MTMQHKTRQHKQTARRITLTEIKALVNGGSGVHNSQTAEDGMKTLLTYGFAKLSSKNINAITKMVKSLREVGTEYNLRVFHTQFAVGKTMSSACLTSSTTGINKSATRNRLPRLFHV